MSTNGTFSCAGRTYNCTSESGSFDADIAGTGVSDRLCGLGLELTCPSPNRLLSRFSLLQF
jgi:hypothetical protein